MIEHSAEGILLVGAEGTILYASPSADRLLGAGDITERSARRASLGERPLRRRCRHPSTSRTFRSRLLVVNGFCRNATPAFSTPVRTTASSV